MGKQGVWETMVQSCSRMRSHGSQPQSVATPRITVSDPPTETTFNESQANDQLRRRVTRITSFRSGNWNDGDYSWVLGGEITTI